MSIKFKTIKTLAMLLIAFAANSQPSMELPYQSGPVPTIGNRPVTNGGLGPITSFNNSDALPLFLDAGNLNFLTTPTAAQELKVFMQFDKQQYVGLNYSPAGLLFGASATTASDGINLPEVVPGAIQQPQTLGALTLFDHIGKYDYTGSGTVPNPFGAPGGPAVANFSSIAPLGNGTTGSGILPIWQPGSPATANSGNGAFSVFTVAQVLYDGGVGGSPTTGAATNYPKQRQYSAGDKYYYGDLVISFNRYVKDPVIHFAGLGGAYRYYTGNGSINLPGNWRSTNFATELKLVGTIMNKLSGNDYFEVSPDGQNILNDATLPSGASTTDPSGLGYPFNDFGAGSGSVQVLGTVRSVRFEVWLRGAPKKNTPEIAPVETGLADFGWSTARQNVADYNREPVTGDLWWVSVSAEPASLIPLPANGVNLSASLVNNDVALSWKTLSENNTSLFEIERSTNGINFTKIGEKAAVGYSTVESNYSQLDPAMNVSTYYYRLKLIDLDGKVMYSNIARVNKGAVKGFKIFPNPATDVVSVEFANAKGSYTISLVNLAGQEVKSIKADITNTTQYVRMDRGAIATGMYYIKVRENNTGVVFTDKVVIN